MRSSTSVSHASGSTPLSFAVWINVLTIAQWRPPLSEVAKSQFLRLWIGVHNRNYVRSRIMCSSNGRLSLNLRQTAAPRGSPDCRYRT
jgi:hypothetical protein